jgi:uncharacterized protein YbjQ (UPF0145 family)
MTSVVCPKCNHIRQSTDSGPDYECPKCGIVYVKYDQAADMKARVLRARNSGDWTGVPREQIPPEHHPQVASKLPMTTTQQIPGCEVTQILEVISAECAYGMNIFKDFFAGITDVVGGRSATMQNTLRDARRTVMAQLKGEAFAIGADAVVGVSLDYSEISGGGKSMLFVVATGTAVTLVRTTQ